MAVKLAVFFFFSLIWLFAGNVADAAAKSTTAAPATDCSSLIINLADCLNFVSNDSTETKPDGSCCSGLKTVLKANAQCLCDTFKNSGQLGIPLNISKALTLPSACHVTSPTAALCGLSVSTPSSSPAPSPTSTASTTPTPGPTVVTPAPAHNKASSSFSVSAGSLIVAVVAAAFSLF
ncbi:hypothetical protein Dimus_026392 [Dionaea muscipula]